MKEHLNAEQIPQNKCWQRTSGTQKGSPFIVFKRRSDKIQKIKRETKEVRTEIHPGKGVLKDEKFPNTRKPSHWQVCGEFWNLRGQHNREENINK